MTDDLVKSLRDNPRFQQFQQYILDKVAELNSIDDLGGMTNEQAGEEVRARAKAIGKLQDILKPFIDFAERRAPTTEEILRAKNKAGL